MDQNKRLKLYEIGYKLNRTCGRCANADIQPDGWGTCRLFSYLHEKHSDQERKLSINRYGSCDSYEQDPDFNLQHFLEYEE